LGKLCSEVHAIPIRRSSAANIAFWLRSRFTGRPYLIERDDLTGMRRCVDELTGKYSFDFIHADQLSMAQFALPVPALVSMRKSGIHKAGRTASKSVGEPVKLIFDAHNAVWTIVSRMSQTSTWYLRPLVREELKRVKHYEGMLLEKFDYTLAVTEVDRHMLLEALNRRDRVATGDQYRDLHCPPGLAERVKVIPIAIDCQQLQPVSRLAGSLNILTLGTLHYPPNADGIRWFAREVFPLVQQQTPQASLTIIGKNPPLDFLELAANDPQRIKVTGYIPDLRPYLEQAALMVVPVRAGSGMRVRILEAFARGIPVVTTSVGLEGINAQPGRDVLVADTPGEFADSVNKLLHDLDLQKQLAAMGRRLVETSYDWRVVLNRLDEIYGNKIV